MRVSTCVWGSSAVCLLLGCELGDVVSGVDRDVLSSSVVLGVEMVELRPGGALSVKGERSGVCFVVGEAESIARRHVEASLENSIGTSSPEGLAIRVSAISSGEEYLLSRPSWGARRLTFDETNVEVSVCWEFDSGIDLPSSVEAIRITPGVELEVDEIYWRSEED